MSRGFSVIELLISIAVLAIISVISVGSIQSLLANNHSLSASDELNLSFKFAKTEAIKLNSSVSVCAASSASKTSCNSEADWQYGWIIFSDPTESGTFSDQSARIKVSSQLPSNLIFETTATHFTFENQGFLSSNNGDITISAKGCSGQNKRTISLSTIGRVSVSTGLC